MSPTDTIALLTTRQVGSIMPWKPAGSEQTLTLYNN